MSRFQPLLAAFLVSVIGLVAAPGDVGFVEDFALAPDRAVPLKELIAGTPEYYYYHCLHYQNTAALDQAAEMLQRWIKKHGHSGQVEEMLNRQALLRYPDDPKQALTRIRQRLGLNFNHARRERERETTYPTQLDPRLLDREVLDKQAFARNKLLGGFTPAAHRRLAGMRLSWERRRTLLNALELPDLPNLVGLVVADLKQKGSRFGSLKIHQRLLLAQLDACAELLPALLGNKVFIDIYLLRLVPKSDEDSDNPTVQRAYLERLQGFVTKLTPAWNTLKANVLYRRLEFDRTQDVYDRARFLAYLRLPRSVGYANPEYLRKREFLGVTVNLGSNVGNYPLLRTPIRNDEPLVRAYLHRFLADGQRIADFEPYLEESYLKEVQAEANILAGTGDQERWHAMISPTKLRALKERVDLDLLPTCKAHFGIKEPVVLQVGIKNVDSLLVRVYEINTFNYYRAKGEEVGTAVDLDGLVANREQTFTYTQPALRRHPETFTFPELNRPGVWVIEMIGNGRSSRAVVRKGQLRFTQRMGSAGHVFRVYDQDNVRVKDAALWLANQEYRPDEDGEITVPFTTSPSNTPIVLRRGEFSTLGRFHHAEEAYALALESRLPLEALVQGEIARLLLQPKLTVQGTSVDIALLEDVTVTLTTTDIQGVNTAKVFRDLAFHNDQMTVCEFRVAADLVRVHFRVAGKVRNVSRARDDQLSAQGMVAVNGIDAALLVPTCHVRPTQAGYVVELFGKTGEPLPGRVVNVSLAHREYAFPVLATLQTDAAGRVQLGFLPGVSSLNSSGAGAQCQVLLGESQSAMCHYPGRVQIVEGEPVELPFPEGTVDRVSLLSLIGGNRLSGGWQWRNGMGFTLDQRAQAQVRGGFLSVRGLQAGDYLLVLRGPSGEVTARVSLAVLPGQRHAAWAFGPEWVLPSRNPRFLGIREAKVEDVGGKQRLTVALRNATADTKVHVLGQRYAGSFWFQPPVWGSGAMRSRFPLPLCQYVSGRDLGDEFRYVLERRTASRRPGNLLTKPSLLLNPWSLGETQTGQEQLRKGTAYHKLPVPTSVAAEPAAGFAPIAGAAAFDIGPGGAGPVGPNYDFLTTPAFLLENLKPDENGVVSVDLDVGSRQYLRILVTNGRETVQQPLLLPFVKEQYRDLRLRRELSAKQHFTEQKRVDIVAAGTPFTVPDMRSSKVRAYSTLSDAYSLLKTLHDDKTLAEFEFVCRWPKLSDEEKLTLYGKYACHELSFFVHQKDRPFFEQVVKPYLANKKDKTFLDHWLLADDLSAYLKPWAYGRLNIVERILLGQRLPAQTASVRRHVQDRFDLIMPNIEAFNHRFDTAVKSASLDTDGGLEVAKEEVLMEAVESPAPAPPAEGRLRSKLEDMRNRNSAKPKSSAPRKALAEKQSLKRASIADDADGDGLTNLQEWSADGLAKDSARRANARQLFRALDTTKEWAENNYYHIRIEQQNASLIHVNGFWRDYAAREGNMPFLSTCFPEASTSFAEMMLALAVLDLPFAGAPPEPVYDGPSMTLTPKHSIIVFHQQIREATPAANATSLLLGQNFFAADDRYRHEGNRKFDKFVTEEFQSGRVYGCQVVVTNPTSTQREIDLLLRIPIGAIPVNRGFRTRGIHMAIDGYATKTMDYHFYFPKPGDFPLYPVHASRNGALLAFAKPCQFHVVEKLTKIDTTSWDYISQYGSVDQVIAFLKGNNIDRLDLGLIAFRMKDKAFFAQAIPLLRARHVFHPVLWSYGALHNDPAVIREYLPHTPLADQCGMVFESPLLVVDPVARVRYQHKEYWPLINARAHRVGGRPRILNRQFHGQYTSYLTTLAYRPVLRDEENLTLAMYLLLQDRVAESLAVFAKVDPGKLDERIQYDYLKAYLAFSQSDPRAARRIARGYAKYPVPRWQEFFAEILAQCDEIDGEATAVIDKENRTQTQTALAATQPSFEFVIEDGEIRLDYQNLESVELNFYRMDLELLFSRTPFLMDVSGQFSIIQPNATQVVKLAKGKASRSIAIPKEFATTNTMVEVVGIGQRQAKPYYPNSMIVQMIEAYGQIKATESGTRKPLPAVYVKVYARQQGGKVVFFKDGYTDLRGRFDYASVSTGDVGQVERFAILLLSDKAGAVVREAKPPAR